MNLNKWLDESLPEVVTKLESSNKEFTKKERSIGTAGKKRVYDVLDALRSALFPGVYEEYPIDQYNMDMFISGELRRAAMLLAPLLEQAFYNECRREDKDHSECTGCAIRAARVTAKLISSLPEIREMLLQDIQAAYDGDPAVKYREEILLSYPYITAITIHRIAHILYEEKVPVIPRIMSEYAHQETGIDINPGAKIGKRFFIDHGTGVVIGETCTIGDNVKIYQGVTLGALSFALDAAGNPIKGIKRHPDIEDDVVIYAGATILGGDTVIGKGSIIGGNVWLTHSVAPGTKVYNSQPEPIIKEKKI